MTPKKKVSGFMLSLSGFLLMFWCLFSFVDVCFDDAGMQSSLLGLALANNFFEDPLVGLPPAVSVVTMSLMAFGLVTYWNSKQ
jgi:hypothetical protein